MGVWIEIISIAWIGDPSPVTPFVGVWIEIVLCETILSGLHVTPFVGVWIEIQGGKYNSGLGSSLPSWECGLKSFTKVFKNEYLSHSLRGSVD